MSQKQSVRQQLDAAQAQIHQLSQQLIAEREAAQHIHAQLQEQLKQQQQRLAHLEAQAATYRHLFDCYPQPLWVYDLETLRFLAVNEAAVAKYGYSSTEFLAMTIADIRPPEDITRLLENVLRARSGLDLAGIWQHCLRDGQIIQVEIVAYAIEFEGRRAELVMAQDVTHRVAVEQALHQSEERYRLLVEFAPQMMWSADAVGLNTYASQRMGEYLGRSPEELLEFDWQTVIHPEDAECVRDRWLESVRTQRPYEVEYRLRRADGVYRWHLVQAIWVEAGSESRWLGMSTDIHDRKLAQLALQDLNQALEQKVAERTIALTVSEARLTLLLAASPATIYSCQPNGDFACNFISHNVATLLGYTAADFYSEPDFWMQQLHPDEAARVLAEVPILFEYGKLKHEYRLRRREGHYVWVRDELTLLRDEADNPLEIVGCLVDIDDRKQAELALWESQQMLQTVLDATPIPIFWKDQQLIYRGMNVAAAQNLGCESVNECVGLTDLQLPWSLEDAQMFQASDRQILASGQPLLNQIHHLHLQDGTELWFELNKVPLRDAAGNITGVLGTVQDVAQYQQTKTALQTLSDRLTMSLQTGAFGTWDWDLGQEVFWDARMYEIFGLQDLGRSVTHQDWLDRVHPDDLAELEANLPALLSGEAGGHLEYRIYRPGGEVRWVQGVTNVQYTADGTPARLFGILRDITDRKQAELALQVSYVHLQAILMALPDHVFRVNREGLYLDFYPSAHIPEITGLDSLVGRTLMEVLPADLAQLHLNRIEHVLRTQTVHVSEQVLEIDGGRRVRDVRVAPCGPDAVVFVIRDITDRKQAELAQQAAQQLLQTVLDTTPIGIFWKDCDGVYQGSNKADVAILGLPETTTVIGLTDAALPWSADTRAIIQAADQQVLATGTPRLGLLHHYTLEDGSQRWIESNKVPLRDGAGNVIGLLGTAQDVSDRQQAELALQTLSDRLSLALEAGQLGVWSWDLGDRLFWDMALCRMYGLPETSQTTARQTWRNRVHSDDIDRVEALLQAAIDGAPYFGVEFRIWRTDGELRWIQSFAQVQHDDQGHPIHMVGLNRDITDRKQAELDLIAYAERVEDLYNNAPCGYCSLDTAGRITQINHTALGWLGCSREVALGQPLTQFMTAASQPIFAEQRAILAQPGLISRLNYEIVLVGRDGGEMAVLMTEAAQKTAAGAIAETRITITDIRQRLKVEHLVQSQFTQENLLRQITARIRQSLDLSTIFETACTEVRQALEADRVAIFQFFPEAEYTDGQFIAESMVGDYPSTLAVPVHDHCFGTNFATLYAHGRYYAVADIEVGALSTCHADILRQFQVRANLVVPLVKGEDALWGLLCIHQCRGPRVWKPAEIDLTQQLANQLAIAINQASLYQRLQTELAVRQQAETQILRQLEQQRTLANLIETVRESLAVDDILSRVTQQVKDLLQCDRVIIFRLYPDGRSCIVEEAVSPAFATLKNQQWEDETWSDEILALYWQGRPRIVPDVMQDRWTDCLVEYSLEGQIQSKMVAPILQEPHVSEQHRWIDANAGNKLWGIIVTHACREKRVWQEPEAELLQQVANSVAIAIQQATLFGQLQQELGDRQHAEHQLAERNQQLTLSNAELERATRLKDEFLANMSHELRTPLNAILGMTEGLQEAVFGPISDRQANALTTIERSGTHLLSLINDVLDVAKIEAGQLELDYAAVSVRSLCDSSLTLVKQQAHKKRLHLETQIPRVLPDLYGDDRRLRQALVNLLSNAVKFTPEGGRVTITATYTRLTPAVIASNQAVFHPQADSDATLGLLTLAVADTGIGISPENAQKLFRPFVQIDSALNRQHEGTGLGLALVKRIVELHGGTVTLTSKVGSGSCFTIALPIIAIPSESFPTAALTDAIAPTALDLAIAPLIVLAEDNEANITTITAYLTAKGYDVVVARNGIEAIDLVTTVHPDVILMDIQMPQMDGLEAIRQIRQIPDLATVPIIALTALAMPADRDRCLAAGANDYLSKPLRLKQLFQTIQTLLSAAE